MNISSNNKHHVLFLFPFFDEGGAPRRVILLSKILIDKNIRVTIAGRGGSLVKEMMKNNIPFIELNAKFKKGNLINQIINYISAIIRISKYVKYNNVNIISNHGRYTSILALFVTKIYKIKFYSGAHGYYVGSSYLGDTLWGQKIFAVSKSTRDNLVNNFGVSQNKISIIKNTIEPINCLNTEEIFKTKNSLNLLNNNIISCVSMYVKNKGHLYLLEALKYIFNEKNIKLILVGYGDYQSTIINYIKDNNLSENVMLLPSETDIRAIIGISNFTVLPSVREGIPTFILESFCLSKPVIAFDVVGVNEIVSDNYNGLLVKSKDIVGLRKAIIKLIDNPKICNNLGVNAKITYQINYSYTEYKKKIIDFYS